MRSYFGYRTLALEATLPPLSLFSVMMLLKPKKMVMVVIIVEVIVEVIWQWLEKSIVGEALRISKLWPTTPLGQTRQLMMIVSLDC